MTEEKSQKDAKLVPIERRARCAHCVYWDMVADRSIEEYQNEGLCRRRAPVAVASGEVNDVGADESGRAGAIAAWPRTFSESDWCGDYRGEDDVRGRYKEIV